MTMNRELFKNCSAKVYCLFVENSRVARKGQVCSRANTDPIYVLTLDLCSTPQYTPVHFIVVPFHSHTVEKNFKSCGRILGKLKN